MCTTYAKTTCASTRSSSPTTCISAAVARHIGGVNGLGLLIAFNKRARAPETPQASTIRTENGAGWGRERTHLLSGETDSLQLLAHRRHMSTAGRAQTDGQSEVTVRACIDMLRSFVNSNRDDWYDSLSAVEFAYNDTVHSSTGYTPFEMNYGKHPRGINKLLFDNVTQHYRNAITKILLKVSRKSALLTPDD